MGDTQSALKRDAAEEEEEEEERARTEQLTEDKTPSNNGQISGMNEKEGGAIAEVNGHCEDEVAAVAIAISNEEDATGAAQKDITEPEILKPRKEKEPSLETVELNEKELPDAKEEASPDNTDVDAKQNDINESFRRFFSSIGLKLTVKKGGEDAGNAPDVLFETSREEQNRPDDAEDATDETDETKHGQNTDVHTAQETCDNDSTTCPTMTENTPEDIQETVEEANAKPSEAREEAASDNTTTSQKGEEDATPEEEADATSPPSRDEEVVVSPIKKFFSTGIFSGLRKKRKSANDENIEKELVHMRKQESLQSGEETVQDQQLGKGKTSPDDEAAAAEKERRGNKVKEEMLPSTSTSAQATPENVLEGKSPPREPSIIVTNEAEILSSQEKIKVQGSPLKRLLSGSSFKKLSKKQQGRRSSDSRLSDSGGHVSDQLQSSTESAENQRGESPAQAPNEAEVDEGTWASFKKLVTPKKRAMRPSLTNEDAATADEPKTSEGEQGSDHSAEEGRKRKDSSVSWEAVLCGSGRRRSRKTSDSEDEMAHGAKDDTKRGGESGQGTESPLEGSNGAASPKQADSPSEGDGGSTWKSLKRLVTPKRKAKDEEESKDDNIQSDGEVTKDESSFSIKKLIPRRKKRKSVEKQDQVSSDDADREAASDDEDSDTPAVVPLSEFETVETEVLTETQAVIESHADNEPHEDILGHVTEPLQPGESLQAEAKKVQDSAKALEDQTTATAAANEESEELSKHQQLSDIPEEGVIEETMATPASATEEVARDDTIAEDLIEITSEAVTAPEPVDITLTDETEMISAVSQLTDSSKTSGNTTPVPAEYDVKTTDVLLHQVVETISITPTAVSLCTNDQSPERRVGSVSPEILETKVKDEAAILEQHSQAYATSTETGPTAEELDAVNELAATAQIESMAEVKEAISTEIIAVTTEDIVTTDITEDEVLQANVSQAQESMKEFESKPLVECLPEENEAMSTEQMSQSEKVGTDEVPIVESNQDEIQSPESEFQEADSSVAGVDGTEDENVEQEVRTKDQIIEDITSQAHADDQEQVPAVTDDLQTLTGEKATTLHSQEVHADVDAVNETENEAQESLHVQEAMTSVEEDVPKPEMDEITASVNDDTVEGLDQAAESKDDKIPESITDGTPQEVQVEDEDHIPEVVGDLQTLTAVHISVVHEDPSSVQVLEKKVEAEDIPAPCTDEASTSVADEPMHEVHLTEVSTEVEKEGELPAIDATTAAVEHAQVAEGTTCGLNDVVASIADTAVEQTAETTEPLVETVACEVEVKEAMEAGTPIMEITQTTETAEGSMVAMMHETSVQFEDNHISIQVQVVEVDIQSAEAVVDAVLEVAVKQANEIIYDSCGMDTDMKDLSPTLENEKEVTTSGAKDVITAIPEVEISKVSETTEPLAEAVAYDLEIKELVETATPLMKPTNTAEAESGCEVVMMHVPSVQFEDNHRIQVQVVDVGMKSAEMAVDTVVMVGLTQAKEVIDVCHEMDNTVENLFATLETEEEVMSEGSKVTIQEVIQQVKESLAEVLPESEAIQQSSVRDELVSSEQETEDIIKPPTAETEQSKMAEGEFAAVEHQEVTEDAPGTFGERPVEDPAITGDEYAIATDGEESQGRTEKFNVPVCSEISIHDDKESLVETGAELTKSKVGVATEGTECATSEGATSEDVTSEEVLKKMSGDDVVEARQPQNALIQIPTPTPTPSNTGIVVPQNTGTISSIGNVEPPSSLSLEFKLNIQFGHAMAPVSSSSHRVQVTEPVEPEQQISPTQRTEGHKQTEPTEAGGQVTQPKEPETKCDAQERAVTPSSPVLPGVVIQAVEAVEPVEQIVPLEIAIPSIQATEASQPGRRIDTAEVLSHPELLAETKAAEPVKQPEEEHEQDVWLDAEENIDTKEETEIVELLESQTEGAICDQERQTADAAHTQEEQSQEGRTPEVETEGDDFAVASEHPEAAAAGVTKMEFE